MSNLFAAAAATTAQRCSVWTRPDTQAPATFRAWGEALRTAFEVPQDAFEIEPEFEPVEEVDVDAIREEAMAEGYAAGLEAGRREAEAERAALRRLMAGLEALKPEPTAGLGMMIAATVERLLHQVVGEVEVCPATLIDRAQAAAALIGDEVKPAVLKLNPDDCARIDPAELPVPAEPDPSLMPGELRLETGNGSIEDGPGLRMERLRAALDRIAAQR